MDWLGLGEVELHLHHAGDNEREPAVSIGRDPEPLCPATAFSSAKAIRSGSADAFIHGNWALDNSAPEYWRA